MPVTYPGSPYFRGRVEPPNLDHLRELSYRRHEKRLRAIQSLIAAFPSSWDSRTKGWIGPIKDQSQCGSCWDFSGTCVVEVAYYKAGILKADGTGALSEEYTLSCCRNGGCNGDDNTSVLAWAKSNGLPLSSDYGQYTASPGRCSYKPSMTLYKIDDWGFADSNGGQGVTSVDDIKTAIMAYGCVGCAVAAGGSEWDNAGPGTILSGSSHNIDHDVVLVGWDDSKGGGAWIMRNSWGTSWGDQGYVYIKYGAYDIGTEAVFGVLKTPDQPPIDWGNL
jgi:cathepsin L